MPESMDNYAFQDGSQANAASGYSPKKKKGKKAKKETGKGANAYASTASKPASGYLGR